MVVAVERYDAVVVGAGPAGAICATVLACGGARVLLCDRVPFPRDKACGDLLSPRAAALLTDLSITPSGAVPAGDMMLVGVNGQQLFLPCPRSHSLPAHGFSLPRESLDDQLYRAALTAGAEGRTAELSALSEPEDGHRVVRFADGSKVSTAFVVGADGVHSKVAVLTDLVNPEQVLWAFALRFYLDLPVELPVIVYSALDRERPLPGYGWLFPGPDGQANLGLGVALGHRKDGAACALALLPGFCDRLRAFDLLGDEPLTRRRGAWLKMALAGTTPARAGVFLVGDAAGTINPLQGEGIAEAMMSGRAAAEAILAGTDAEGIYRRYLAAEFGAYYGSTAAAHQLILRHPGLFARFGNLLTLPALAPVLGPGWAAYWNQLQELAEPGMARTVGRTLNRLVDLATRRSALRRTIERSLGPT